jgi:hypothetical protein
MLASDVKEWLETNSLPGYKAHVMATRAGASAVLEALGLTGTDLAELYESYGAGSVYGWYELNEAPMLEEWTRYAIEELGVSQDFVALTGIEGQGITLYSRTSGAVFDVEFGKFEALAAGALEPVAASVNDFLRWCRARQGAA